MYPLKRYFNIASFIGIALVAGALSLFFRDLAVGTLTDGQTRANVRMTQGFLNKLWPDYRTFVIEHGEATAEELAAAPQTRQLRDEITTLAAGLNIVKIKIYSRNGNTVFSTDPQQLGLNSSGNAGFKAALDGEVSSALTFRDQMYAFENVVSNRNILSSYMPIRGPDGRSVEGVFELYSDITPMVSKLERTQHTVFLMVLGTLSVLYLFLSVFVRRADRIIRVQAEQQRVDQERIQYQAYHDELTGLPNRPNFTMALEAAINHAKRNGERFGLLYIDVDRFKQINDSLGHAAGDFLLKEVAQRMCTCIRASDRAYRLGGDEFVVLLGILNREDDAGRVARRINQSAVEMVAFDSHEIRYRLSIGIAVFPGDGDSLDALVHRADTAMYAVKQAGGHDYRFYSEEMNLSSYNRLRQEADLRAAIDRNEFRLYYQPKIQLDNNRVVGIEALLRWVKPDGEVVLPEQFITLLEETGLIIPVGDWALVTACAQNKRWHDAGLSRLPVSVNISPRQFQGGSLVESVGAALIKTGLEPRYLELELNETMLIANVDTAITMMEKLKDLGVLLSIDDFGSGYSSMTYLRRFPVDNLKIDRSFILGIHQDEKDAAITRAITTLARSLNLGLVAEGVETEAQMEYLRDIGCPEVQGFFTGRPQPPEALEAMLQVPEK